MTNVHSAKTMQHIKDTLRIITDQPWIREGSLLKCTLPLRGNALQQAIGNLKNFNLSPEKVPSQRGISLTLVLDQAAAAIETIKAEELDGWAKGIG